MASRIDASCYRLPLRPITQVDARIAAHPLVDPPFLSAIGQRAMRTASGLHPSQFKPLRTGAYAQPARRVAEDLAQPTEQLAMRTTDLICAVAPQRHCID